MLLVDDDLKIRDLTAAYLERIDDRLQTETAPGPENARDVQEVGPIDRVVSDYDMPDVDSLEFLRQVRDTHPNRPFILCQAGKRGDRERGKHGSRSQHRPGDRGRTRLDRASHRDGRRRHLHRGHRDRTDHVRGRQFRWSVLV